MKKNLLLFVLVFGTIIVMAQNNYVPQDKPNRILVSVFAGPTLDWVQPSTVEYELKSPSLGARVGIPVEINLNQEEHYYFATGLYLKFDQTSLKFPEKYSILNVVDTVTTNRYYSALYLTIPTGIKIKTSTFKKSVFGLNLGLYHSFFISGKTYDSFTIDGLSSEPDYYSVTTAKIDNKYCAMFKESVYGGIGYEYKIKPNLRAYVYANYVFTFTNFFNPNLLNSINQQKESAITQSVELIVGIGL